MSIFVPVSVACPACQAQVEFRLGHSVNADRRPDLRDEILDRSFQRATCEKCSEVFRMDPEITYFDSARKQWILAQSVSNLTNWRAYETQAEATVERTYGPNSAFAAQALGQRLSVRVVFGWAALREKLLCRQHELDDVTLELLKVMVLRSLDQQPFSDDVELRLVEVKEHELALAWMDPRTEAVQQLLDVPKDLYAGIVADAASWAALRDEISAGPFVDMNRLLLPAA